MIQTKEFRNKEELNKFLKETKDKIIDVKYVVDQVSKHYLVIFEPIAEKPETPGEKISKVL